MRRILFIFLAAIMTTTVCSAAMSNSKIRKETRFLTDKMAYEMQLSTPQYNDVYEINYDFIVGIGSLMDNVLRGEEWALNRYYDYLDVRNDDLRWVLSNRQYSRFMRTTYFFRPIYVSGSRWSFRIYITYTNPRKFYYPVPHHYRTYRGGHYRTHHHNASYYRGRHNHPIYDGHFRIRDDKSYHTNRRSDFGTITIKPNSNRRPAANEPVRRPSTNQSGNRPNRKNETTSPNRSERRTDKKNETTTPKRSERRTESVRRGSSSSKEQVEKRSSSNSRRSSSSSSGSRSSSRSAEKDNDSRR